MKSLTAVQVFGRLSGTVADSTLLRPHGSLPGTLTQPQSLKKQ